MISVGVVIPQFMTSMGVICVDISESWIPSSVNQSLNVSELSIDQEFSRIHDFLWTKCSEICSTDSLAENSEQE